MRDRLWCPRCGGEMIGDGVRDHLHCENVVDHDCTIEPDAAPQYCDFPETATPNNPLCPPMFSDNTAPVAQQTPLGVGNPFKSESNNQLNVTHMSNWSEAEWAVTVKRAEEFEREYGVAPGTPCDGHTCLTQGPRCEATDNGRFSCTLPHGHACPHSACATDDPNQLEDHNVHVWSDRERN